VGKPQHKRPMNEDILTVMAACLGACCLLAVFLGNRSGNEKRDMRLMMGSGAALGGVALIIFSIRQF
jgi:hypothetical protein